MNSSSSVRAFLDNLSPLSIPSDLEIDRADNSKTRIDRDKYKEISEELSRSLSVERESNRILKMRIHMMEKSFQKTKNENEELKAINSDYARTRDNELFLSQKLEHTERELTHLRQDFAKGPLSELMKRHDVYLELQRSLSASVEEVLTLKMEIENQRNTEKAIIENNNQTISALRNECDHERENIKVVKNDLAHIQKELSMTVINSKLQISKCGAQIMYITLKSIFLRLMKSAFHQIRACSIMKIVKISSQRHYESKILDIVEQNHAETVSMKNNYEMRLSKANKHIERLESSRFIVARALFQNKMKRSQHILSIWKNHILKSQSDRIHSLSSQLLESQSESNRLLNDIEDMKCREKDLGLYWVMMMLKRQRKYILQIAFQRFTNTTTYDAIHFRHLCNEIHSKYNDQSKILAEKETELVDARSENDELQREQNTHEDQLHRIFVRIGDIFQWRRIKYVLLKVITAWRALTRLQRERRLRKIKVTEFELDKSQALILSSTTGAEVIPVGDAGSRGQPPSSALWGLALRGLQKGLLNPPVGEVGLEDDLQNPSRSALLARDSSGSPRKSQQENQDDSSVGDEVKDAVQNAGLGNSGGEGSDNLVTGNSENASSQVIISNSSTKSKFLKMIKSRSKPSRQGHLSNKSVGSSVALSTRTRDRYEQDRDKVRSQEGNWLADDEAVEDSESSNDSDADEEVDMGSDEVVQLRLNLAMQILASIYAAFDAVDCDWRGPYSAGRQRFATKPLTHLNLQDKHRFFDLLFGSGSSGLRVQFQDLRNMILSPSVFRTEEKTESGLSSIIGMLLEDTMTVLGEASGNGGSSIPIISSSSSSNTNRSRGYLVSTQSTLNRSNNLSTGALNSSKQDGSRRGWKRVRNVVGESSNFGIGKVKNTFLHEIVTFNKLSAVTSKLMNANVLLSTKSVDVTALEESVWEAAMIVRSPNWSTGIDIRRYSPQRRSLDEGIVKSLFYILS